MIVPILWKVKTKIHNLPELPENVRKHGGAIIEYQRIFDVLVFSRTYPILSGFLRLPRAGQQGVNMLRGVACLVGGQFLVYSGSGCDH
jgi:hypothetical protein